MPSQEQKRFRGRQWAEPSDMRAWPPLIKPDVLATVVASPRSNDPRFLSTGWRANSAPSRQYLVLLFTYNPGAAVCFKRKDLLRCAEPHIRLEWQCAHHEDDLIVASSGEGIVLYRLTGSPDDRLLPLAKVCTHGRAHDLLVLRTDTSTEGNWQERRSFIRVLYVTQRGCIGHARIATFGGAVATLGRHDVIRVRTRRGFRAICWITGTRTALLVDSEGKLYGLGFQDQLACKVLSCLGQASTQTEVTQASCRFLTEGSLALTLLARRDAQVHLLLLEAQAAVQDAVVRPRRALWTALGEHLTPVTAMAWAPAGLAGSLVNACATATRGGALTIWEEGREGGWAVVSEHATEGVATSVAWSADARTLVYTTRHHLYLVSLHSRPESPAPYRNRIVAAFWKIIGTLVNIFYDFVNAVFCPI